MNKIISLSPCFCVMDSRVKVAVKFHGDNAADYTRAKAKCPHSCFNKEIAGMEGDGYTYPISCPHCS